MSQLFSTPGKRGSRNGVLNLAAGTLWYAPRSFSMARFLGPSYSLRCVLFHDISDTDSPFTRGLGVTTTRKNFELALRFITSYYTPVSLQDIIDGRPLPHRPVLVTFDDAYASVAEFAVPLCSSLGVPTVFFINASCLDNQELALDNLVCYAANVCGLDAINTAIRAVQNTKNLQVGSLTEVFSQFLPSISLSTRAAFRNSLLQLVEVNEDKLSANACLYLSSQQLRDLQILNCEIGNHTHTHVHCRSLSTKEFVAEIDQNREELELITGRKIRSFSVPYGSSIDLTNDLLRHLQQSGYEAAFLSESLANSAQTHRLQLNRVSLKASDDAALFSEIEVLPRLRAIRNSTRRSDLRLALPAGRQGYLGKDTGASTAVPKRSPGL